jgi:hypothetical protein
LLPSPRGRRAGDEGLSGRERHARRSGLPHERDFCGGETVGLVDEVGESAFEREGFGGLGAGRFDGAGVFVAETFEGRDGRASSSCVSLEALRRRRHPSEIGTAKAGVGDPPYETAEQGRPR